MDPSDFPLKARLQRAVQAGAALAAKERAEFESFLSNLSQTSLAVASAYTQAKAAGGGATQKLHTSTTSYSSLGLVNCTTQSWQ
jgi:hypothetical protein